MEIVLKDIINYKGINVKKDLYPIIKHIEDVDKYKDELETLSYVSTIGSIG